MLTVAAKFPHGQCGSLIVSAKDDESFQDWSESGGLRCRSSRQLFIHQGGSREVDPGRRPPIGYLAIILYLEEKPQFVPMAHHQQKCLNSEARSALRLV